MKKALIILCLLLAGTGFAFAEPAQPYNASFEAKMEYNQGVDYYKAGQYDLAMNSFRQAISIDPNYIDAYYNLGSILEYLHQDESALAIFKQIIVRNPNDFESVYKAANLSKKLGQVDKAKTYLSLIPATSSSYAKAQDLAASMNTDMQTIKADEQKAVQEDTPKLPQTNGMYNNIPSPTGITTDKNGNVYVSCFADNMIYKLTPDGKRIVFVKNPKLNGPIGMAGDDAGNIYVSNYNSNNIIKVTPAGAIATVVSNIQKPYGVYVDGNMLFVSSQGANSVLRYKL